MIFVPHQTTPFDLSLWNDQVKIDLTGRKAVVTGSTSGIGLAIAKGLAGAGADVVVNGRRQGVTDGVVSQLSALYPEVTILDTGWHHLAITKSGSTVVFYVDGIGYPAPPYDSTFDFYTDVAIGARGDDFESTFRGAVDEILIFNRILTADEIRAISTVGASGRGR